MHRFPIEWRNPFGFLIAISTQCTMFSYGVTISAYILSLGGGAFLYALVSSKVMKGGLLAINRRARAESDQTVLLEQIVEFLKFHSSTKELSAK